MYTTEVPGAGEARESIKSPGTIITDCCEQLHMGARNLIPIWKSLLNARPSLQPLFVLRQDLTQ